MNPTSNKRDGGPDGDVVGVARSGAGSGEGSAGTVTDDQLRKKGLKSSDDDRGNAGAVPRSGLQRKLTKYDSLDVESMRVRGVDARRKEALPLAVILRLAYQSIGVVYGDVGTSPLYVFGSTFSAGRIDNSDDILGVLSIIIYILTLIPLIKYVFIVLRANDNGEGGTFALYSLLCRHARLSLVGNQVATDRQLSTYQLDTPKKTLVRASKVKDRLERSKGMKKTLIVIVLIGTCLVIGDGVLTPAISVLSAIQGLQVAVPSLSQDIVVYITIVILIGLFGLQRFGTSKVSFLFAPVVLLWFVSNFMIGIYNIAKYDPTIFKALSPHYIYLYFKRTKQTGWISLGGIVLCITGTEAMFADLGHFNIRSIQIAFTALVYPCLLVTYTGQAAFLMKNQSSEDVSHTFFKSLPKPVYWPMFAVATMAAIIASQAMISATFSIIKQSMALSCFPRVTIQHTSKKHHGQIYIPEINWTLMILCIIIVVAFKDTSKIGNAYGVAVVGVMLVTTSLVTLIKVMIWQSKFFVTLSFVIVFGVVELIFFSSVLYKVPQGGYVPIVFAAFFLLIMFSWHYGTRMKYEFEVEHKVPLEWVLGLGSTLGMVRVPGIGLVYTELAQGVPAIFKHFVTNLPAIHSTLVFVCVRDLPVSTVPVDERILIRRVGPREYRLYRCAVRYGYTDGRNNDESFEELLMQSLAKFIQTEVPEETSPINGHQEECENSSPSPAHKKFMMNGSGAKNPTTVGNLSSPEKNEISSYENAPSPEAKGVSTVEGELNFLYKGREAGVVYLLGHSDVHANKESWFLKRFIINYVYDFLRRICRHSTLYYDIPSSSLLKVGMTYYV